MLSFSLQVSVVVLAAFAVAMAAGRPQMDNIGGGETMAMTAPAEKPVTMDEPRPHHHYDEHHHFRHHRHHMDDQDEPHHNLHRHNHHHHEEDFDGFHAHRNHRRHQHQHIHFGDLLVLSMVASLAKESGLNQTDSEKLVRIVAEQMQENRRDLQETNRTGWTEPQFRAQYERMDYRMKQGLAEKAMAAITDHDHLFVFFNSAEAKRKTFESKIFNMHRHRVQKLANDSGVSPAHFERFMTILQANPIKVVPRKHMSPAERKSFMDAMNSDWMKIKTLSTEGLNDEDKQKMQAFFGAIEQDFVRHHMRHHRHGHHHGHHFHHEAHHHAWEHQEHDEPHHHHHRAHLHHYRRHHEDEQQMTDDNQEEAPRHQRMHRHHRHHEDESSDEMDQPVHHHHRHHHVRHRHHQAQPIPTTAAPTTTTTSARPAVRDTTNDEDNDVAASRNQESMVIRD